MEMNFHSHANKTHFYMNRLCTWPHFESEGFGTRKWPIADDKKSLQSLNLQVVITHASYVCSQHLIGLPLRMIGMHRTLFDHAHFDLLPLVIWSRMFWPSVTRNLRKTLTAFDLRSLSPALRNLWLLLVIYRFSQR